MTPGTPNRSDLAPGSQAHRAQTHRAQAHQAQAHQAQGRRAEGPRAEDRRAEGRRAQVLGSNRRGGIRLAARPGVVVGVASFLLAWAASALWVAVVVGVVIATLAGVGVWVLATPLATRLIGARAADAGRQPRVHNLLDRLCPSAGVTRPELWVLDSDVPNSAMLETRTRRARLVVTTALVASLTRVELEAVLAHELMHLRSGDAIPATLAVVAAWPAPARARDPGAREAGADLAAVEVTRYPPGLAAALEVIEATARVPLAGLAGRLSAHLWLASPGAPLGPRIAVLRDL